MEHIGEQLKFPSLIGRLKTHYNEVYEYEISRFPSLVGRLKTNTSIYSALREIDVSIPCS